MKVVDAGVVIELLVGNLNPGVLGDEELAVPHLLDSEVAHVLRGLVRRRVLSDAQGSAALDGFLQLALTRFPADFLRPRIWDLRHNLTGYDATYVALAELLEATALLTTNARIAAAPGLRCHLELL